MNELLKTMKAIAKTKCKDKIFKTGFSAIDDFAPIENGSLTIIAGVHNIGKTNLALNIIDNVSLKNKIPSTILTDKFSYEVIENLVSIHYEMEFCDLSESVIDKIEMIENAPVYLGSPQEHGLGNVFEQIYRLCERRVRLFVIDDIKILGEPHEEYGYYEQLIKLNNLAQKLNIVILLLVSLPNEEIDERSDPRPTMNDLCKTIDTDVIGCNVWLLYRNSYYNCVEDKSAEIIIDNCGYIQNPFDNDMMRNAIVLYYEPKYLKYYNDK